MNELVMSREELPILFNDIYCGDKRYFNAVYPFYGTTLFTVDFKKPEIAKIVDRDRLTTDRKVRTPRGMDFKEMIGFDELRDCLVSSGVLGFVNNSDVVGWLRKLKRESLDRYSTQRFLFVAVDTNIMYHRFISRHLSFKGSDGYPFYEGLRYMVSDIVRDEIDSSIKHKYSGSEISAFKGKFNRQELVDELRNGSDLRARKAKLAFNECEFVRRYLEASRASGQGSNDKEDNDRAIARSYMERAKIGNHEACLLTADEDMITHARTADMTAMQLIPPTEVPRRLNVEPWRLRDLVHDIAVVFGALSLENKEDEITVLGEWRGKTSDDYLNERVKVLFSDADRHDSVSEELRRCRDILGTNS